MVLLAQEFGAILLAHGSEIFMPGHGSGAILTAHGSVISWHAHGFGQYYKEQNMLNNNFKTFGTVRESSPKPSTAFLYGALVL